MIFNTNKKIFKIGSCRLNLKDYFNNFEYNYSYSHSTKEVFQWLDILENKINIEDIPYIDFCIQNQDKFDLTKYQKIYQESNILLIEISSLKIVNFKNYYYNLNYFQKEIKQDDKIKEIFNINNQTEEELHKDLLDIQQKVFPKKVIFIGHLLLDFYDLPNFNPIHRSKIDNVLRKVNNSIILSELFKDFNDYKDVFDNDINHLKESSKKIIANKIFDIIFTI